jgi:hypothetical protein
MCTGVCRPLPANATVVFNTRPTKSLVKVLKISNRNMIEMKKEKHQDILAEW